MQSKLFPLKRNTLLVLMLETYRLLSGPKTQPRGPSMPGQLTSSYGASPRTVNETPPPFETTGPDCAKASGLKPHKTPANMRTTTDASNVVFDETPPTLPTVTIASDNADPTLAKVGDTVTINFTADELLIGMPTVTIDGNAPTSLTNPSGNDYVATRVMEAGDTEIVSLPFTINFTDATGNAGTQVDQVGCPIKGVIDLPMNIVSVK